MNAQILLETTAYSVNEISADCRIQQSIPISAVHFRSKKGYSQTAVSKQNAGDGISSRDIERGDMLCFSFVMIMFQMVFFAYVL